MASGYVTSDGKDLDSRYLGINAKAASASKADSATNATNANYATSAGTATNVTNKGSVKRSQAPIYVSGTSQYTAPSFGIYAPAKYGSGAFTLAQIGSVRGDSLSNYFSIAWVCNKGEKISRSTADGGVFFPITVS